MKSGSMDAYREAGALGPQEPDECEHGAPADADCYDCLKRRLRDEQNAYAECEGELEAAEQHLAICKDVIADIGSKLAEAKAQIVNERRWLLAECERRLVLHGQPWAGDLRWRDALRAAIEGIRQEAVRRWKL